MNKFNYLKWVGTTIIGLPVVIIAIMIFVYKLNQYKSKESITTEIVEVIPQPKVDSVLELVPTQIKKVVPKLTLPKPIVKDTLPNPIVKKLDSIKLQLDTTINN